MLEPLASYMQGRKLNDLYSFNKNILGYNEMAESPHRLMCESVQHSGTRHLDLWPRGTFKSSMITIGYTIQQIALNPNIRILITNATLQNSRSFLREIKTHFERNERLREIIDDQVNREDKWTETEIIVKGRAKNLKEPTIQVAGVGMSLVSQHYDIIIGDDLVNTESVNTPEQIEKTKIWFKMAMSLLEPGGKVLIIGTRYHFDDLYGWIIKEHPEYNPQIHSIYDEGGNSIFPERFTPKVIDDIKKTQGSYLFSCTPGDTEVLMGDFTNKAIRNIKVGDEVIGYTMGRSDKRGVLQKTIVTEVNSRISEVQKVFLSSGSVVRCTPDHHWFTGRLDKTHRQYLPAKVGRTMVRVLNEFKKPDYDFICDWRYLAGIIDGEGACKYGSINISQSRKYNPEVYAEIKRILDRLKIDYKEYDDERKHTSMFSLRGGRSYKVCVLQYGKPAKKDQIINTILSNTSRIGVSKEKVVSIEPNGEERVYALTTGTGNYISQNFASKNCQYLNSPIDDENAKFKKSQIKYKEVLPDKQFFTTMTVDRAYSLNKTADYTGITVCKKDSENFRYIPYARRARYSEGELINKIFDLKEHYKVDKIGIEQHAFEFTLKPTLDEEMRRRNVFFEVVEIKNKASKIARIEGLVPYFESGSIYFVGDPKEFVDMEEELLRFPMAGHDDLSDSLAMNYDEEMKGGVQEKVWIPPSKGFGGVDIGGYYA